MFGVCFLVDRIEICKYQEVDDGDLGMVSHSMEVQDEC